jgi:hypothetical protein
MRLEDTVGKKIDDFCESGFTDPDVNHCAHFVAHHLNLKLALTCSALTRTGSNGASVRVQEIFAKCHEVGMLSDWNGSGRVLVFVTAKSNVDLANKRMRNVPKKHIGIYDGQHVYHYGNTQDRVRKQTLAEFKNTFQRTYGGDLGFYYGTEPSSITVERHRTSRSAARGTVSVAYEIRDKKVYATLNGGPEYFVAQRVKYGSRIGLAQMSGLTGPSYNPDPFISEYGSWAYLVYAIGVSESENRFNRINSYDRAEFTFGFFQFAAHTPKDNLILLLRRAAEIGDFQRYFPELQVTEGRLHHISGGVVTDLETEVYNPQADETHLLQFMRYLNPSEGELDDAEIIHAAKLVALCDESPAFCELQVRTAIQITARKFRERYQHWYDLAGATDSACLAIADIHHQGRGKKPQVRAALQSSNPINALAKIGENKYPERCRSLRKIIKTLESAGKLGRHKYEPAHGVFVPV